MSKRFDPKNTPNLIENPERAAQELYGYDDETLLRELKEAEMELEQMKAEDPELEAKLARETEASFEALMQKIHAENIKPVTEREYAEKKKEEERNVTVLRPVLKVMFIAAAIMVVLSGMGIVVSARKEFEYSYISKGKMKNEVIWQNGDFSRADGQLKEAYQKIKNELGIKVLVLDYMPKQMIFDDLVIDKGHARIKFLYGDQTMYLKEIKDIADDVSDYMVSDRKEIGTVYNSRLVHDFVIEENKIEDDYVEYSTMLKGEGVYYYLSGVMEKEEFMKIVKYLNYLQE